MSINGILHFHDRLIRIRRQCGYIQRNRHHISCIRRFCIRRFFLLCRCLCIRRARVSWVSASCQQSNCHCCTQQCCYNLPFHFFLLSARLIGCAFICYCIQYIGRTHPKVVVFRPGWLILRLIGSAFLILFSYLFHLLIQSKIAS